MSELRTIDISSLKHLGSGDECSVYDLGSGRVIKCFKAGSWVRRETNTTPEEVFEANRLLAELKLAPPTFEMVEWVSGESRGRGYICAKAKTDVGSRLFLENKLNTAIGFTPVDCHRKNIGKYKGRTVLIDCGYDCRRLINAARKKLSGNSSS